MGSAPADISLRKRQLTDAFAGGGEDRVGDGGGERRQHGFAESGGRVVALKEVTLDFPGRVGHAEELIFGEVGLDDATALDVELLAPGGAEAVDDGTFNLVFGATEIDDLRADIGHADDAIHAEFAGFRHGHLGDLGNVTAMTKVKRDTLTLAAREFFAPARFFGDEFDHGLHARGIIGRSTFSGAGNGAVIT